MLEVIADHFNNHDTDFAQRMQLAYEKVFFDSFHKDFTTMYTVRILPLPLHTHHVYCCRA